MTHAIINGCHFDKIPEEANYVKENCDVLAENISGVNSFHASFDYVIDDDMRRLIRILFMRNQREYTYTSQ